jgi:tetratricopeptide (TPR) repeat protein
MLRIWKVTLDADIEAPLASWVRQLLEQRNSDTTKSFVVPVSREDATDHLAEINKQVRAARDYPLALRLADATVKLTPEFYGGYMRRAQARVLAGGSSQAALADAGEAIRLAPNNAYAYEIRGAIHYELGNAAEAVADYTKAVELAPENERLKKDLNDALAKRAG